MYVNNIVTYIVAKDNFTSLQLHKTKFTSPAKYTLSHAIYQKHLLLKISYNNCLKRPKKIFQNK